MYSQSLLPIWHTKITSEYLEKSSTFSYLYIYQILIMCVFVDIYKVQLLYQKYK